MAVIGTKGVVNPKLRDCVIQDAGFHVDGREILIVGDFSGHIEDLDGHEDTNGKMLLSMADQLMMAVVNLWGSCEGQFTWSARGRRSCIDYVLISPGLGRRIRCIHIDEDGQCSIGSDHNHIRLDFSHSALPKSRKSHRTMAEAYLQENAIVKVAIEFETSNKRRQATTYEEYVNDLRKMIKQYSRKIVLNRKLQRKKR